jgi:hypothetical protein
MLYGARKVGRATQSSGSAVERTRRLLHRASWRWGGPEAGITHHWIVPEARDPRIDLAKAHPVALAPHRVDDEPEAAPVFEPRVKRAECRRLRRELEEAERGRGGG